MILSPAKSLDMTSPWAFARPGQPRMLDQAQTLVSVLRGYSTSKLKTAMKISDSLAALNVERYQQWTPDFDKFQAKPAVLAFTGDVYQGLDASTLEQDGLTWLQGHCRILSGLYGLLRPMDLIKPYRLEMGTALKTNKGSTLYEFWGDSITQLLNKDLKEGGHAEVVNLASQEYFKSIHSSLLTKPVVTPVFKEDRAGVLKVISFNAKRARGLMVRFAVDNRINAAQDLKQFSQDGYQFHASLSDDKEWLFVR